MLQKDIEHAPSTKTDAATAFLASLEEPKLTSLAEAGKKPPIEILPPGMVSLSAPVSVQKKPVPAIQGSQQQPGKPLLLEAPPATTPVSAQTPLESSEATAEANNLSSSITNPAPDPEAPAPTIQASTSGPALPEDATNEPDTQEMSVPAATLPLTDPLT